METVKENQVEINNRLREINKRLDGVKIYLLGNELKVEEDYDQKQPNGAIEEIYSLQHVTNNLIDEICGTLSMLQKITDEVPTKKEYKTAEEVRNYHQGAIKTGM